MPEQRWLDIEGRRFVLRTLGADDAPLLGVLWNDDLSGTARRMRFHCGVGRLSRERLEACCKSRSAVGEAFLLTQLLPGGEKALAEGRWAWTAQAGHAELSVSVADAWQGRGLGRRMLQALTLAAQAAGAKTIQADVLLGNGAMQALLRNSGFVQRVRARACCLWEELDDEAGDDTLIFVKDLLPHGRVRVRALHDSWRAAASRYIGTPGNRCVAALAAALALHAAAGARADAGGQRPDHAAHVQR